MDLTGKTALVTGGAQGIGKAASFVLSFYGASVAVTDAQESGANNTADEIIASGNTAFALHLDVTQKESIQSAVAKTIEKFGKIDILVNAAGIAIASRLETLSEELWDRTMDVNAKGVFLCSQAVIGHMRANNGGKIVNISSRAAKVGEEANGAYCCSKAAIGMFTQVLALEMAPYNINVNAVCPGLVDTEMIEKAVILLSREKGAEPETFLKNWIEEVPLKRMAKPQEIGELVAFLASDKSNYITGASFNITGGAPMV